MFPYVNVLFAPGGITFHNAIRMRVKSAFTEVSKLLTYNIACLHSGYLD